MTLKQYMSDNSEKLDLYTKAISKVHGDSHPEVHEVKALYETMKEKVSNGESVDSEFESLRNVTSNYALPSDACETYQATYEMLKEADGIYSA